MKMPVYDIHTHRADAPAGSIINIAPGAQLLPGRLYSAGIHPWDAGSEADIDALAALCSHPQVVAIGETGIDLSRPVDPELQRALFATHADLSRESGKPLILHVVKAWSDVIAEYRRRRPAEPWIVHGFRGKPQLARQLLDSGLYLSYGERFNPLSLAATPASRRLMETDCSELPIDRIAALQGVELTDFSAIFPTPEG